MCVWVVKDNGNCLKKKEKQNPKQPFPSVKVPLKNIFPMVDSYWCMAKPIQYCKVKINK